MDFTFNIGWLLTGLLIAAAGGAIVYFHQPIANNLANGVRSYDHVKLFGVITIVVGLLTAVVTAFCGPVAFIGLAVPHMARLLLKSNNHKVLLPCTMMLGSMVALACNMVCQLPGESGLLPLGAITPLIGAPVIIYVVLKNRNF